MSSTTAAATAHETRVAAVARQLRDATGQAHVSKGGVRHFVPVPGDSRVRGTAIDTSALTNVLEIDVEHRTCTAEPGASFADVVTQTLQHGLLPKVVPELTGITLGGAVAGCSLESMSFRFGGFHDACLEYEVLTGTGEARTLTPADELFHLVHGSYGTLAILTRITFELTEAKPAVEVTYRHHKTFAAFHADLREHCDADAHGHDFVDGIVHAPDHLTLCVGRFTDAPVPPRKDVPYYKATRTLPSEVLSTFDYCFRYDRDCHWLSRTFPPLEWEPVRRAAGRHFLGSTNLIRWSNRLGALIAKFTRRPDVVVDLFIPDSRFAEFAQWYETKLQHWPLWVVPYRIEEPYPWINREYATRMTDRLMIDVAIYGKRNSLRELDWSEVLERKTHELGGIKTLISRNHYSREEFWKVYDRDRWTAAKAELDPVGRFNDLYEKFRPR